MAGPNNIPLKEPEEVYMTQLLPDTRVPVHVRAIAAVPAPVFVSHAEVVKDMVGLENCVHLLECWEGARNLKATHAGHIIDERLRCFHKLRTIMLQGATVGEYNMMLSMSSLLDLPSGGKQHWHVAQCVCPLNDGQFARTRRVDNYVRS